MDVTVPASTKPKPNASIASRTSASLSRPAASPIGLTNARSHTRVASNGNHAEFVGVGVHLTAKIPDEVTDDQAAFTVLGAIALQGVRLAQPTLGETFCVIGLGVYRGKDYPSIAGWYFFADYVVGRIFALKY